MQASRRKFIHDLGALTMGGIACCKTAIAASESGPAELPIVDTHVHLWDLSRFRLPWLKSGEPLCRSYVPKDYQEASAGLNIVKSVYMEVDMDPADEAAEAESVIAICRGRVTPMRGAVIGGRPASEGFRRYLLPFKGSPYIKGVRQILRSASELRLLAAPDDLVRGLRLLGEWGMCFDLCVPPTALADGARLIGRCPETRFVLDHCGNADPKASAPADEAPIHNSVRRTMRSSGVAISSRWPAIRMSSARFRGSSRNWSAESGRRTIWRRSSTTAWMRLARSG